MEQKNSKIFSRETMQAVSAFCETENIKDIDQFMYLCFKQGFDIKRYGLLGETLNDGEKHLKTGGTQEKRVEIEVIREIRVEVPVEVIKEVEVIREVEKVIEVPVEVIKEVEKIIYTSNDEQITELLSKMDQLNGEISIKTAEIDRIREEFSAKMEEMENIFQNKMSKKDEELDELRRKLDIPVTNDKVNMLQETLQKLRGELQEKNLQINNLQKINNDLQGMISNRQGTYLRSSNLRDRL
jgi:ElaB/YqjD/DUF883 family membrane-anchored ribosome-binding protein